MYEVGFLTNRPVHPSMYADLARIAARLDQRLVCGKRVLEIGAGTGHFARILAQTARSVMVFEPSRGLTKELVPESNITLVNSFFSPTLCEGPVDLIVCRQVLEHLCDPVRMLRDMRQVLRPGGVIYLEVPRAEYVEDNLALIEFHNAHVQYFHEDSFSYLALPAGLIVYESWHVKQGHDMGFLLRPSDEVAPLAAPVPGPEAVLGTALSERRKAIESILHGLTGRGALYGANWQGESFAWLFGNHASNIDVVLDDNDDYVGYHLYTSQRAIPIRKPNKQVAAGLDFAIVTAHLHTQAIAERLRAFDFRGDLREAVNLTSV